MGIKNSKTTFPQRFPSEEKTITLGDGPVEQFAVRHSIDCKSIEYPEDSAPKYNLKVEVVDSPEVNFDEEFTLMKGTSVKIQGADLKIRFDGSSHKRLANGGGAVGFFHLTTTVDQKQEEHRFKVDKGGPADFKIGSFSCRLINYPSDHSVTLMVKQVVREKMHN